MTLAKIGDLVELLDHHRGSGIIGIITDKEALTQMPIVTWLNIEEAKNMWPQQRLKVISEASIG
jgi:hypothetical protein